MKDRIANKLAIIAGEESGQLLATELVVELNMILDVPVELSGVGGQRLANLGLSSIFNPAEIALTGVSDVAKNLPRLLVRIRQTADAIIAANPDCLLLVDSPDFSLRVAKRVRAKRPDLPIIKYVAPTVWAWRPGRAQKMATYVDMVLAILPFEPAVFEKLDGPKTHYVGHRLVSDKALDATWKKNFKKKLAPESGIKLLVLAGSRRSEIKSLIEDFGKTIDLLLARGHEVDVYMPTLPRLERELRDLVAGWDISPKITTTRDDQIFAYLQADAALMASGTVTLELALAGVPAISCYKLDPIMKLGMGLIKTWSGALPNIIADRPVIKEFYSEQIRPGMLARCIEDLIQPDGKMRSHTMDGYALVRDKMAVEMSASKRSAQIVADVLSKQ